MAGRNLRLRHSPGERRREVSRDTHEAPCETDSGVRDIPCLLPLSAEMHAVRQCGAPADSHSPRNPDSAAGASIFAGNASGFSALLTLHAADSGGWRTGFGVADNSACGAPILILGKPHRPRVSFWISPLPHNFIPGRTLPDLPLIPLHALLPPSC